MRRDIEQHVQQRLNGALGDLYRRLGEAVGHVCDRLGDDENGKPKVFRDSLIENETVIVSGSIGADAIGAPQTVTIADDEGVPGVTLVLTPDSIEEDGGASAVTATVSPASPDAFTVTVSAVALAPADAGSFTLDGTVLSFAAGTTESTGDVTIAAVDDERDTADKSVTISGTVSVASVTAPADATLTILDDDTAPATVTLSVDVTEVNEGAGATPVTVTGTLDEARNEEAITVTVSVDSGAGDAPAIAGTDFAAVGDFELTIPQGDTSAAAAFTLAPVEDRIDEPDECVRIAGASQDADVSVTGTAVAIADNDEAPSPELSVHPDTIDEDGGVSTVTVSTGEGSTFASARTVMLTLAGTATRGSDYTAGETVLELPAGTGNEPASVTAAITAVDDDVADPNETVIVAGSIGAEEIGAPQTVTIADDEGVPAVTLVLTPEAVTEGGEATVTARVHPASSEPFGVTVGAAPGPAVHADAFTLAGATLSFAAGATESTGSVSVRTVDDHVHTGERTVIVSGTVSATAGVTAPPDAVLSVLDDDAPPTPTVTLLLRPDSIGEDGGTSTVTATVSPASPEPFTVTVSAVPVAPADDGDIILEGTVLSFAAEAAESTGQVTITAVDNDEDAPDRTITVSGAVSLQTVAAPADAILRIVDDEPDVEPGVRIMPTELSIVEGEDDPGVYRVTLTTEPFEPVTVGVTVPAGSGLTVRPPRLRFTPLDWNVAQRVWVTAAAGGATAVRTVRLGHSATGSGFEAAPVDPVEVTVTARVEPTLPELRLVGARGPEAAGPLVFRLDLSHAAEDAVTVAYATRDATARAGPCRLRPARRPPRPARAHGPGTRTVSAAPGSPPRATARSIPPNCWPIRRSGSTPGPGAGTAPRSGAAATTRASTCRATPCRPARDSIMPEKR